nr:hypothetical protein B0A51_04509 [Rachicladosporium sp. CCFEE 5018]
MHTSNLSIVGTDIKFSAAPEMPEVTRDREQRRADEKALYDKKAAYEDAARRQRWSWRNVFGQRRREPDEECVNSYEEPRREKRKTATRHTVRRKPSVLSTRSTTYSRKKESFDASPQASLPDG